MFVSETHFTHCVIFPFFSCLVSKSSNLLCTCGDCSVCPSAWHLSNGALQVRPGNHVWIMTSKVQQLYTKYLQSWKPKETLLLLSASRDWLPSSTWIKLRWLKQTNGKEWHVKGFPCNWYALEQYWLSKLPCSPHKHVCTERKCRMTNLSRRRSHVFVFWRENCLREVPVFENVFLREIRVSLGEMSLFEKRPSSRGVSLKSETEKIQVQRVPTHLFWEGIKGDGVTEKEISLSNVSWLVLGRKEAQSNGQKNKKQKVEPTTPDSTKLFVFL